MAIKGIRVAHAMPGRVRLLVDKVKGNPAFAHKAQDKLGQMPGIEKVETHPLTGSVLIYYDAATLLTDEAMAALTDGFSELFPELGTDVLTLGLESLIEHLAAGGASEGSSERPRAVANILGGLAAINDNVAQVTGGFDLKFLIPMSLLFLGARSLWTAKETAVPAWYDFLWFGFSTFFMMNLQNIEGKEQEFSKKEAGKLRVVKGKKNL